VGDPAIPKPPRAVSDLRGRFDRSIFSRAKAPPWAGKILCSPEQRFAQYRFSLLAEGAALEKLVHRYASVPMSLADACLVRLAKLHPHSVVFTLDNDFRIYRRDGRQPITLLMP
jgi:hypothetical protein